MNAFLTINGKDYSHKDVNLIRDFFTDEQWECIFDAVNEYKDYPEKDLVTRETESIISQVFSSAY